MSRGIPENKYVTTPAGFTCHYHEQGQGRPVVFIHGSGPGASGYSNFKLNAPYFARNGLRAILPDLVGYGYSDKPGDAQYTLDFFVRNLRDAIHAIGLREVALVGNSLGGAIALQYALDYPDEITELILMAPGGVEDRATYMEMPGIQAMMAGFLDEGGLDRAGLRELLQRLVYTPGQYITDQLVDERFTIMQEQPKAVLQTMRVPNLESRLGELNCPVLGFWGMDDQFNPASGAMKFLRGAARTKFVMLTECGHWVMVEYAELFNTACVDFLTQTRGFRQP